MFIGSLSILERLIGLEFFELIDLLIPCNAKHISSQY